MTNFESIYPGTTFLLDPEYSYMGYTIPLSELGGTTSIQTANQLKEVNNLLNQGVKNTELSVINPEVFEMMPKDHLKEIKRLNLLTGAESTLHAPTLDPSGFTQQGWSRSNREEVEKQFTNFVERSHELSPDGNMPVTIHASVIPGSEMIPTKIKKEGGIESYGPLIKPEERGKAEVMGRMIAVDQETGQFIPLEREFLYSHHRAGPQIETPEQRLDTANNTKWIQAITNLAFYKKEADEILVPAAANIAEASAKGPLTKEQIEKNQGDFEKLERADLFLDNVDTSFRTLFEQAAKYPNPKHKEYTNKILNQIRKEWEDKKKVLVKAYREDPAEVPIIKSNLIDKSLALLRRLEGAAPLQYRKVEDFAKEKASETLSNVALNTYNKFGEKSPIISIENPPYGSAISNAEDLKELIKDTRRKFTEKLVNQGISKSEAQDQAKKLIGATWDTSHISMMRKQGFGKEKIVEETRKIAPYVKHVHLNDNFGSTHTDLPPGKGSLPMSEVMKELEKAKFKGKKIFEGGGFFQHFQTSPFPYQLEEAGSPLYGTRGVTWNQLGGLGAYYMGHGPINTPIHHSTYGLGFTTLPVELGGEMPGGTSRFSGTPNQ
jgi:hypothetical protein